MVRKKIPNEQKAAMLSTIHQHRIKKAEEKKMFNKQFRKSPLFISSWVIRLVCLTFFLTAIALHNTTFTISEEILTGRHISRDSTFQGETQVISTIYLTTNKGKYTGDISAKIIPGFDVNDTMLIQKNIFGKPTFFTQKNWPYKYELDYGLVVYYILIFLSLVSMAFNDGQDKFTRKILWIFMLLDLVGVIYYFVF